MIDNGMWSKGTVQAFCVPPACRPMADVETLLTTALANEGKVVRVRRYSRQAWPVHSSQRSRSPSIVLAAAATPFSISLLRGASGSGANRPYFWRVSWCVLFVESD